MKTRLYVLYDMMREEDTSSLAYLTIEEVQRRNNCLRKLNRSERWILNVSSTQEGDLVTQYVSGSGTRLKPHEHFD